MQRIRTRSQAQLPAAGRIHANLGLKRLVPCVFKPPNVLGTLLRSVPNRKLGRGIRDSTFRYLATFLRTLQGRMAVISEGDKAA